MTRVTHAAAPAAQPHGRRRAREKPRGPDPYSQQLLTMSLAIGSVQGYGKGRLVCLSYIDSPRRTCVSCDSSRQNHLHHLTTPALVWHRRRNNRLFWREYALSVNDPEGNMITSEINTRDLKPFHFVRVRNFQ